MGVFGNFCSWNCASGYIYLHFNNSERWEKLQLLNLLYKEFYKTTIDHIEPSPPKTLMRQYGGDLTPLDYNNLIKKINQNYNRSIEYNLIKSVEKE